MVEEITEPKSGYTGEGLKGPVWTAASVGIGGLTLYGVNTLLKYALGGGQRGGNPPWARDMDYERALTEANAKAAALEAKLECRAEVLASERRYEDKFDAIEKQLCDQRVHNATADGVVATIAAQTAQLMRMTNLYIAQPVMAASEAALNFNPFAAKTATTPAANGGTNG